MPVQRFRSFEAAREALWGEAGDPEHLRRVRWLWAFADRLCARRFPPGVYRYRSIDEAQRERERWELEQAAGGEEARGGRRRPTQGADR